MDEMTIDQLIDEGRQILENRILLKEMQEKANEQEDFLKNERFVGCVRKELSAAVGNWVSFENWYSSSHGSVLIEIPNFAPIRILCKVHMKSTFEDEWVWEIINAALIDKQPFRVLAHSVVFYDDYGIALVEKEICDTLAEALYHAKEIGDTWLSANIELEQARINSGQRPQAPKEEAITLEKRLADEFCKILAIANDYEMLSRED